MRGAEFAELKAFLEVSERGSFARAAAHLGVSSPAVSQAIKQLETRLGVRLLNRTSRAVSVTEAGDTLARRLRPAMDDLDNALEGVTGESRAMRGKVRITVSRVAADLVLRPRLEEFRRGFPAIEVEVSVNNRFVDIVRDRFDLGIRRSEYLPLDLIARRLTKDERWVTAASPSYVSQWGQPTVPSELKMHECILIRRLATGAILPWKFTQSGKTIEQKVSGSLVVDDPTLARSAAVDGLGIAFLAESFVRQDVASGKLLMLLADWCPLRSGFFLYRPAGVAPSIAVRSFISAFHLSSRTSSPPALFEPGLD